MFRKFKFSLGYLKCYVGLKYVLQFGFINNPLYRFDTSIEIYYLYFNWISDLFSIIFILREYITDIVIFNYYTVSMFRA